MATTSTYTSNSQSQPIGGNPDEMKVANVADISAASVDAMGPMRIAQVGNIREADKTQLSEDPTVREKQMTLAGQLEDRVAGKVPAVSELQFKQNLDRIIKAQAGAAAMARGGQGSALAQRESAIKGQEMMAEGAREAAILRAQEQKEAEQTLAGVLGQVRTLDINKIVEQGKLDTQTELANLQSRTQKVLTQAQIEAQAYETEYTTEMDRRKANAAMEMQARVANQNKNLQVAVTNAQNAVEMAKQKMASATAVRTAEIGAAASTESANIRAQASVQSASISAAASRAIAAANLEASMYKTDVASSQWAAEQGMSALQGGLDTAQKQRALEIDAKYKTNLADMSKAQLQQQYEMWKSGQPSALDNLFSDFQTGIGVAGAISQIVTELTKE